MEINHRQQSKNSEFESSLWIDLNNGSKRHIDYIEIEKAIKDFCFIKHELSNYDYLYASQLLFDIHLNLPYWEYLFVGGQINRNEKDELEENALLTIYLLFKEIYEAEGYCYLFKHKLFDTIKQSIQRYNPDNDRKRKLVEIIVFAQDNYSNERLSDQNSDPLEKADQLLMQKLIENDNWVLNESVKKYFIDKAMSFK
ncbi:hypothetical protein [uncultured Draconibacterium sp.]|uniref:hypothetical protein n=1 Tax=uncultured Draconibacterium sp. TaxID=1573823 RepID=UPI0029C893A9|nr:hypothetical protein [uncultured Draconibacterium sp.]